MTKPASQQPLPLAADLAAEDVAAYLSATPDFFLHHPEVLEDMLLPSDEGENIASMAAYQAIRLRQKMARTNQKTEMILKTTAHNLESAEQVQSLALALVRSDNTKSLEKHLTQTLKKDMGFASVQLHLDMPAKDVGALFSSEDGVELRAIHEDTNTDMHGKNAGNVASDALLHLKSTKGKTLGLLAIGHSDATYFHDGQGTELLEFLGGILSTCVERVQ